MVRLTNDQPALVRWSGVLRAQEGCWKEEAKKGRANYLFIAACTGINVALANKIYGRPLKGTRGRRPRVRTSPCVRVCVFQR